MTLRTLVYRLLNQRTLQRISERFWTDSINTYAAPTDYYEKRERELDAMLGLLPYATRALDQGCGNGRFTAIVAKYSSQVDAYDISPALIASAKALRLGNINFEAKELEVTPLCRYDLVTCMGVTSCIIDDEKYARTIDRLAKSVQERGHLLLIDTISRSGTVMIPQKHGHIGKYRNVENYINNILPLGFSLVNQRTLCDWSQTLSNRMFLFKRA